MIRVWSWKKVYSRGSGLNLPPEKLRIDGIEQNKADQVDIWVTLGTNDKLRITMSSQEAKEWSLRLLTATGWKLEPQAKDDCHA